MNGSRQRRLVLFIGDRILDLGCGSGEQALAFQNAGCDVIAIDSSASMVKAAKALGESP